MKKQYRKRMFAHIILSSLLLTTIIPLLTLAKTNTRSATSDQNISYSRTTPCSPKSTPYKKAKGCPNPRCNDETYDFVIVGAGIGGSVLAGRLTENKKISVCLLEAGQDSPDPLIPFPVAWTALYFNPEHDWSFWTDNLNQPPIDRLFAWPRGKMLGGSSNR